MDLNTTEIGLLDGRPQAIMVLDEYGQLTIFKVNKDDDVEVKGICDDFEIPIHDNYKTFSRRINRININLSYFHMPDIICVKGTLGGLIGGLFNDLYSE